MTNQATNQVTAKDVLSEPAQLADGQVLMRYTGAYVAPAGLHLGKYQGWKGQDPVAVDAEDVERLLSFGVWEVAKADAGGDASDLAQHVTQQEQSDVQGADDKLRAEVDALPQLDESASDNEDMTPKRGGRKARADKE